jgi:hypothetical protein
MARQRASQARDAFARVGTAAVGPADDSASDSASGNAGVNAGFPDGGNAGLSAVPDAGGNAGELASTAAGTSASRKASASAGRSARGKASARRRVGRPRGPDRVALTIRILAANDERLTAAVDATGQSPQYVVDAALSAYFDALGIPHGNG